MRFMVIVHPGDRDEYEAGDLPDPALVDNMMRFNEELVTAGVMEAGEGLHPTESGARVFFSGDGDTEVATGPWPQTNELVGGFWIWNMHSMEEALNWAQRAPMEKGAILEVRQIFDAEHFGADVAVKERALQEKIQKQRRA